MLPFGPKAGEGVIHGLVIDFDSVQVVVLLCVGVHVLFWVLLCGCVYVVWLFLQFWLFVGSFLEWSGFWMFWDFRSLTASGMSAPFLHIEVPVLRLTTVAP